MLKLCLIVIGDFCWTFCGSCVLRCYLCTASLSTLNNTPYTPE